MHVWLTFRQKLIDLDWSVTRQFATTCRYSTDSQALAFHKPVQPVETEKFSFGRRQILRETFVTHGTLRVLHGIL
jgi:hypothetical protein